MCRMKGVGDFDGYRISIVMDQKLSGKRFQLDSQGVEISTKRSVLHAHAIGNQ